MAHNLMNTEKGHAYVGVGDLAWHKLGVTVKKAMTSKEAIELAQLDYKVGIKPLHAQFADGWVKVKSHNVTFNERTNNIFGVVGSRYEVIQNSEAFDFMDNIVQSKQAIFHTAGALGQGETMFLSVKLPKNIRLASLPDEEIENYLLFTSSHDGTGSIKILFTPIRVVCNNTLNAAVNSASSSYVIKHTKNARNRLNDIQMLFMKIASDIDVIGDVLDRMAQKNYTETEVTNVIGKLVLKEDSYIMEEGRLILTKELTAVENNLIYNLKKSIYSGVGQSIIKPDTAYGIYNGVTSYLQNSKRYKTPEDQFKTIYQKANLGNKVFKLLKADLI